MKIFTVSNEEHEQVAGMFAGHEIKVLPKNHEGIEADLIIFTGGASDIHPSFYRRNAPKNGFYDPSRDEYELKVFREIRQGSLLTKKVMGICRGMQMLAVGFAGTLVYDIQKEYGMPHKNIHPITWMYPCKIERCFSQVNSLHHQGIASCNSNTGYKLLAYESKTGVPEVVVWGTKYLGVQFHPELMLGQPGVDTFKEMLEDWVMRDVSLIDFEQNSSVGTSKNSVSFSTTTYTFKKNSGQDW